MPSPSHHRSPNKSSPGSCAHSSGGSRPKMTKKDPSPISSSSAASSNSDGALAAYFGGVLKAPFPFDEDECSEEGSHLGDREDLASYGYEGISNHDSTESLACIRPRTLPIEVDSELSLLMELEDDCLVCGADFDDPAYRNHRCNQHIKGKKRSPGEEEEDRLARNLAQMYREDKNRLQASLQVPSTVLNTYKNTVSCLTCRKKMDVVRDLIMDSNCNALCPLVIVKDDKGDPVVTFDRAHFSTIEHRSDILANVLTKQAKVLEEIYQGRHYINRKSGRCSYHTISGTKNGQAGAGGQANVDMFSDSLMCMSDRCMEALCMIGVDTFHKELHAYLVKHSFCCECKNMVMSAYEQLTTVVGDDDTNSIDSEASFASGSECCHPGHNRKNDFCEDHKDLADEQGHDHGHHSHGHDHPSPTSSSHSHPHEPNNNSSKPVLSKRQQQQNELFKGLKVIACPKTGKAERLDINTDPRYLRDIVSMAETELKGQKRERHAKTIEAAQREILTCVGVWVFERFIKCYKLLGEYNQICEQLVMVSLKALKFAADDAFCNINGPRDKFFLEEMDRDEEAAKIKQAKKKEKKQKQLEKKKQEKKESEEMMLQKAKEAQEKKEQQETERKRLAAEKKEEKEKRKAAVEEEKRVKKREEEEERKKLAASVEQEKENVQNNARKRLNEADCGALTGGCNGGCGKVAPRAFNKRQVSSPYFVDLVKYDKGLVELDWIEDCTISDDEIENFRERHNKWHDELGQKKVKLANRLTIKYNIVC